MSRQDEFYKERLKKLDALKQAGINPYPQESARTHTAAQLQKEHKALLPEHFTKNNVTIVGRVMSFRDLGKIAFGTVRDGTGTIQVVLQEPNTPAKVRLFTKDAIDTGDIIQVTGTVFRTKRGELSVEVNELTLLTKSLAALPDKWHGLEDKEERYRKRYIDLLMSPEVKATFEARATIIATLRSYLQEEGFLEVETPALQSIYGGASAAPFKTHLNALDIPLYLSISPELYLKRLVVGGYERVFTICKNFRNEGIDRQHNPEFTMMEYYAAYKTYEYHMEFTEALFGRLKKALNLGDEIEYQGKKISLKLPFKRVTFRDLMLKEADIDIDKVNTYEKLKAEIHEKGLRDVDIRTCMHYGALLDELYKRVVRPSIIQPTFLTHYPVEMIALAKRNQKDPSKINSVQLIIDGAEMMKAYDELNDPLDQEARLQEQAALLKEGSAEAMPMDTDFIDALKLGLPPTAGYGMGIDRITMLLTNSPSIRDVILFPFMKPEVPQTGATTASSNKEKKAKETKVAVALVNKGAKLKAWEQMNAVSHLSAAFGARIGRSLFMQDTITTQDDQKINLNIQHAIMIKEAGNSKELAILAAEAKAEGIEVAEFTREMLETTDDRKVIARTAEKSWSDIEYLGVLLFGRKSDVEKLTTKYPLLDTLK